MNLDGCYEAGLEPRPTGQTTDVDLRTVCPFSSEAKTEDDIGRSLFGVDGSYHPMLGYHIATYTGYVAEGEFRAKGSSGGLGKWILYELLRKGLVDAVIQISPEASENEDGILYGYSVMRDPDEVLNGSKSVYYPVEMSDALSYIREHPGRYAITGIPCFVKALRLLAKQEGVFRDRIKYCVGLICGHLKSRRYADMIGWQFGIRPGDLGAIDFRTKLPGARANEKGVTVRSIRSLDGEHPPEIVQNLFGTNYNHGFFQYKACNFCDDVVGETSDISVGDAWLDQYLPDGRGTSVLVVRRPEINELIQEALGAGRLHLERVDPEVVVESQAGGFRQRREGLSYRLELADKTGEWRPPKRVQPGEHRLSRKRRQIYELRAQLSERSHQAFKEALETNSFDVFKRSMEPLLDTYQSFYRPSLMRRVQRGIQRRLGRIRKWLGARKQVVTDKS